MDLDDKVRFCGTDAYAEPEPYCINCYSAEWLEDRPCLGEGSAGCHRGEVTEGLECARCEGTGSLPYCTKCERVVDIADWWRK
jgi:hypothetical protein